MAIRHTPRTTPLSDRVDRADERVRLIEEAVLLIRGDWPAIATGLCERVNSSVGLIFSTPGQLDEAIRDTSAEAMLLVQELYGHEGVAQVERMAAIAEPPAPVRARPRPRHRLHLRPNV
ncbi:MAG: hypothetical protein JST53_14240 [Actinobacteria bacterium]|nr:hypothetical protein [Actinomycetota bacterium]